VSAIVTARRPSSPFCYRLLAGVALTALMSPSLVFADDLADDLAVANEIETIVVTADRKPISTASKTGTLARDVPASIQVVSAQIVTEQAALSLNEVVRNVSGIQPIYGGGYGYADNYVIRGLRMKFLRDGVADGPTFVGYARSFSDVERVEVLKGPGSAIYGRSEPGGTINLVTKQPSFTPLANFGVTIGESNTLNLQGDLSGPLSTNIAARLTGEYSNTDGIRGLSKNIGTSALALVWNLSETQKLTAKGEIYRQNFVVDNFGIPAGFSGEPVKVDFGTRYYTADNRVEQAINRLTLGYVNTPTDDATLRATYRFDGRELNFKRNAAFNLNAAGQISSINQRGHDDDSTFQIGQLEGVLDNNFLGFKSKTLVGIEVARDRFSTIRRESTFTNVQNLLAPTPLPSAVGLTPRLIFDRDLAADTTSIYAQHEVAIGEKIKVRGGYRVDFAKYTDVGVSTATPVAGQAGPLNRRFSEQLESGQIGVVYQPTQRLSIYGGYSKGAFINIQTESTALSGEPETSNQIELGVKYDIVPNALNLNVAVFKIQRRNYNVTLAPGAAPVPLGAQNASGIEFDLSGKITDGLNIIANYSLLNGENVSREIATTFGGTPFVRTGSMFGLEAAATVRNSGSMWVTYDLPVGIDGLSVGLGVTSKGRSFADTINAIRVPGYTIGNAAIFWRQPKFELALNVKNITDERYFENPTFAGGLPGDPRTVVLSFKAKY
jgi:iron complex outermembrane recepter protein